MSVSKTDESLFFELERHISAQTPVAAVYGTGKQVIENPEHVDAHRQACRAEIVGLQTADVVLVGVRFVAMQDDPILHDLLNILSRSTGDKTCVNPSPSDCDEFRGLGFTVQQKTLEEWLADR